MINRNYAITSLLEVLDALLHEAADYTSEALHAIQSGKDNQAAGTLLYIEQTLPLTQALYTAALTLHRLPAKAPTQPPRNELLQPPTKLIEAAKDLNAAIEDTPDQFRAERSDLVFAITDAEVALKGGAQ